MILYFIHFQEVVAFYHYDLSMNLIQIKAHLIFN